MSHFSAAFIYIYASLGTNGICHSSTYDIIM